MSAGLWAGSEGREPALTVSSSLVDPSRPTSGPHEALQNQEARQQSVRRLHVRQVCA